MRFHPAHQAQRTDLGAGREPLDEVDDIVTSVVRNPVSAQLSPSSFFVRTSSSTTSASTSVLFLSWLPVLRSYPLPWTKTGSGPPTFKGCGSVLKKGFLPLVEERRMQLVLVARELPAKSRGQTRRRHPSRRGAQPEMDDRAKEPPGGTC